MKRFFTLANLTFMAVFLLAGCATKHPIVGTWMIEEEGNHVELIFSTDDSVHAKWELVPHGHSYSFFKDGSTLRVDDGTYSLTGNQIKMDVFDETIIGDYTIKEGILSIIANFPTGTTVTKTFTRVK